MELCYISDCTTYYMYMYYDKHGHCHFGWYDIGTIIDNLCHFISIYLEQCSHSGNISVSLSPQIPILSSSPSLWFMQKQGAEINPQPESNLSTAS